NLGVVRGVVVRSRSVIGTTFAGLQTMLGGNISACTSLAEKARRQAFATMLHHPRQAGANAVVGVRCDANEMMRGVTEVLCYGTAVLVEPDRDRSTTRSSDGRAEDQAHTGHPRGVSGHDSGRATPRRGAPT